MRLLAVITDAYGSRGGIAQFNRDTLGALCAAGNGNTVTALPRHVTYEPGPLPEGLTYVRGASRSRLHYVFEAIRAMVMNRYDAVLCGHLNLLPIAVLVAFVQRVPLILVIHGIDAWQPASALNRAMLRRVTSVVSVSAFTRARFLQWAPVNGGRVSIIPNCVDLSRFEAGPKPEYLGRRYGLSGRTVIMTLARLAGSERYKGFDEVLELMSDLSAAVPDISYLIVGDGPDRPRLEAKARELGVADRVVFSGYIEESEKADHYRLADLFVMPGRGEGFGIVYLEAMACGVPVIASKADASQETVLGGRLGAVVDPSDPNELREAILSSLRNRRYIKREELEYFSHDAFRARWFDLLSAFPASAKS